MFFQEGGSLRGKNSPSRQASWNVSKKHGFPPQKAQKRIDVPLKAVLSPRFDRLLYF